ncbi:MAG: cupin domain-containing protein [Verrucomicrobiota bacterium]
MKIAQRRFVTAVEKVDSISPWAREEWLCRSDVVPNQELLMVRVTIEPGRAHPFHRHPHREEIIYILTGRAEQWIGRDHRILGPGEMVFIPKDEVHGTYNPFSEALVFLVALAPAVAAEPDIVDVSAEAPWIALRNSVGNPLTIETHR